MSAPLSFLSKTRHDAAYSGVFGDARCENLSAGALADLRRAPNLAALFLTHARLRGGIEGIGCVFGNLWILDVSHSNIDDVSPLRELRGLGWLDVSHTPVSLRNLSSAIAHVHLLHLRVTMTASSDAGETDAEALRHEAIASLPRVWAINGLFITDDDAASARVAYPRLAAAAHSSCTNADGVRSAVWQRSDILCPNASELLLAVAGMPVYRRPHGDPTGSCTLADQYRLMYLLRCYVRDAQWLEVASASAAPTHSRARFELLPLHTLRCRLHISEFLSLSDTQLADVAAILACSAAAAQSASSNLRKSHVERALFWALFAGKMKPELDATMDGLDDDAIAGALRCNRFERVMGSSPAVQQPAAPFVSTRRSAGTPATGRAAIPARPSEPRSSRSPSPLGAQRQLAGSPPSRPSLSPIAHLELATSAAHVGQAPAASFTVEAIGVSSPAELADDSRCRSPSPLRGDRSQFATIRRAASACLRRTDVGQQATLLSAAMASDLAAAPPFIWQAVVACALHIMQQRYPSRWLEGGRGDAECDAAPTSSTASITSRECERTIAALLEMEREEPAPLEGNSGRASGVTARASPATGSRSPSALLACDVAGLADVLAWFESVHTVCGNPLQLWLQLPAGGVLSLPPGAAWSSGSVATAQIWQRGLQLFAAAATCDHVVFNSCNNSLSQLPLAAGIPHVMRSRESRHANRRVFTGVFPPIPDLVAAHNNAGMARAHVLRDEAVAWLSLAAGIAQPGFQSAALRWDVLFHEHRDGDGADTHTFGPKSGMCNPIATGATLMAEDSKDGHLPCAVTGLNGAGVAISARHDGPSRNASQLRSSRTAVRTPVQRPAARVAGIGCSPTTMPGTGASSRDDDGQVGTLGEWTTRVAAADAIQSVPKSSLAWTHRDPVEVILEEHDWATFADEIAVHPAAAVAPPMRRPPPHADGRLPLRIANNQRADLAEDPPYQTTRVPTQTESDRLPTRSQDVSLCIASFEHEVSAALPASRSAPYLAHAISQLPALPLAAVEAPLAAPLRVLPCDQAFSRQQSRHAERTSRSLASRHTATRMTVPTRNPRAYMPASHAANALPARGHRSAAPLAGPSHGSFETHAHAWAAPETAHWEQRGSGAEPDCGNSSLIHVLTSFAETADLHDQAHEATRADDVSPRTPPAGRSAAARIESPSSTRAGGEQAIVRAAHSHGGDSGTSWYDIHQSSISAARRAVQLTQALHTQQVREELVRAAKKREELKLERLMSAHAVWRARASLLQHNYELGAQVRHVGMSLHQAAADKPPRRLVARQPVDVVFRQPPPAALSRAQALADNTLLSEAISLPALLPSVVRHRPHAASGRGKLRGCSPPMHAVQVPALGTNKRVLHLEHILDLEASAECL